MADIHVPLCSIVAFDPASICYRVCGYCEQVLPPESSNNVHPCERYRWRPRNPALPPTKHLYKLLMSIVTDKCAMVVVVFDRAARNLFGCPADEFLRFLSQNASAVQMASKVVEGEMLSLVLRPPKGGYCWCCDLQTALFRLCHFRAHSNPSWLFCLTSLPRVASRM